MSATAVFSHGCIPSGIAAWQSPVFYPLKERNTWRPPASPACLVSTSHLPTHFPLAFPLLSQLCTNTPKPVLASQNQVHSDARTGQAYQQEVLNPAPDGCETAVALNRGGGRGEQPDMAMRKCFFAPQYICLTICRVTKPSGIAVRRNKLQEGKWGALLKMTCQLPAGNFSLYFPAFLPFMQAIGEVRGSRRNVSVSS